MSETYVAIDFDGTIVTNRFPELGEEVPGAFKWMRRFQELGAKLILLTMRSHGQRNPWVLRDAINFCETRGIVFDLINENPQDWTKSNKVYAHVYIDDHNAGCPVLQEEKSHRIYVDWEKIGPSVERYINDRNKRQLLGRG